MNMNYFNVKKNKKVDIFIFKLYIYSNLYYNIVKLFYRN